MQLHLLIFTLVSGLVLVLSLRICEAFELVTYDVIPRIHCLPLHPFPPTSALWSAMQRYSKSTAKHQKKLKKIVSMSTYGERVFFLWIQSTIFCPRGNRVDQPENWTTVVSSGTAPMCNVFNSIAIGWIYFTLFWFGSIISRNQPITKRVPLKKYTRILTFDKFFGSPA